MMSNLQKLVVLGGTCFSVLLFQSLGGLDSDVLAASQAITKATTSCDAIEYSETDDGSILITDGFPYQSEYALRTGHMIRITEVIAPGIFASEGGGFITYGEVVNSTGGFVEMNQAVGVTWEFTAAGIEFFKGNCKYVTQNSGSTIRFTRDGVVVTGLDILNP
jgi:hypothetical protein